MRLSRRFFSNELWKEARTFSSCEAWLDLLQSARFEATPRKGVVGGREISYTRGQYPASIRFLSQRWKWSEKRVRSFLVYLKKNGMITVECTQGMNLITLCNYEEYNPSGTAKGTQKGTDIYLEIKRLKEEWAQLRAQLGAHPSGTGHSEGTNTKKGEENNKEKPSKEGKKRDFDFSFVDDSFKEAFNTWIDYKKARRESYKTQKSLEACYNKLFKLSGGSFITANEIINQSMANNWAGLFELKKESYNGKRTDTQARRESVRSLKDLSAAVLERIASNED